MSTFAVGQRWLSETEPELGLGIVQDVDHRLVTIFFPAAEEERTYSREGAPLSRMTWDSGDVVQTADGLHLKVVDVDEMEGMLFYQAHPLSDPDMVQPVPESQLSWQVNLAGARERLFARQLDHSRWFEFRYQALQARAHSERSDMYGLRGPRIDLIPHQLYIAHEVARRHAPRVLLADEVGLGKTIEAGLIIHQQLVTERASRVLIVVPPALLHQWFVEMARRFNLHFSIFDEARLAALREELEGDTPEDEPDPDLEPLSEEALLEQELAQALGDDEDDLAARVGTNTNPFLSEQLVLCSTSFLEQCDFHQLLAAEWDLLVVDEAHHMTWSEDAPSEEYRRVESLSRVARGLLLLTATPEQLGRESHFARLRLLDPERYPSLEQFLEEQTHYEEIAELAGHLHDDAGWTEEVKEAAQKHLPDMDIDISQRDTLLRELIDRAGTGRVLFRNTRKNVAGFPERRVHGIALPCPDIYQDQDHDDPELEFHPERQFRDDSWCQRDPRVDWLSGFLKQHRGDKVLVICAHRETASDLHAHLGYKHGLNIALFHEQLDLIERDRAAAWFAEEYDGAQALICSEIGSEGRNFQFAHHLVLFDLPQNPDLLEQRIGRLDRIGQTETVHIHVPYFEQHPQAVLFKWYHEGMDAFEHTNSAGGAILEKTRELLAQARSAPQDSAVMIQLVGETRKITRNMRQLLDSGRDRLLELSSCDPQQAAALADTLRDEDAKTPMPFMEQAFEHFGVDSEFHSEHALVLHPGEQMVAPFPGLPDEGITVTDDRRTALARDDMQFLTWEHPMVTGVIDMVLSDMLGRASVCLLKNPRIKAGTLLVECIYTLDCVAPRSLQAHRYLPLTVMRTLNDAKGKEMGEAISHAGLSKQCQKMEKGLARKVIASQQSLLEKLLDLDHKRVTEQARPMIDEALKRMASEQEHELNRLILLREKNPAVPRQEIDHLIWQTEQLEQHLRDTRCQLAAIRVIVAG